jgi:hypothetical protein
LAWTSSRREGSSPSGTARIANLTATIHEELGDDVVFIFSTDNGGMPHVGANNYPLRGGKQSAYNGGSPR